MTWEFWMMVACIPVGFATIWACEREWSKATRRRQARMRRLVATTPKSRTVITIGN